MSVKSVNNFFLSIGLLSITIFSAASISNAQSQTSSVPVGSQSKEVCSSSQSCNDYGMLDPHPTPEPITVLLFGTGLFGVAAIARRHLQKTTAKDKNQALSLNSIHEEAEKA